MVNYPPQSDHDGLDVDKKYTNIFVTCTGCYSCAQFSYALMGIQIKQ